MSKRSIQDRAIDQAVDSGKLPDAVLRRTIRTLLSKRLDREMSGTAEQRQARKMELIAALRTSAVALSTDEANEQHYEVPAALYELMLGEHLKYSSGYWPEGVTTLDQSEAAMLRLTVERAQLADGDRILELGCGWGSLTLFMAAMFPNASITAVSNSASQRRHIVKQAAVRGLDNVEVITCDVNLLTLQADSFDRVVSVEMFEHVRNHAVLLERISSWLVADGTLFVHHFSHREALYPFDVDGRADWMARHFFTDGLMPSDDLLLHFPEHLQVSDRWVVDGTHYARTCEAWLDRLDASKGEVIGLFSDVYGADAAPAWFHRWRVFDIACAELFGFDAGQQWWVTHLLLRNG